MIKLVKPNPFQIGDIVESNAKVRYFVSDLKGPTEILVTLVDAEDINPTVLEYYYTCDPWPIKARYLKLVWRHESPEQPQ
jgi:hypothetical protein